MKKYGFLLDKARNMLYRASLVILLGMFLYVFGCAFFDFQSMPFLTDRTNSIQKGLLMGGGVVLFLQLLFLVNRVVNGMKEKYFKIVVVILFSFLAICQLFFLHEMKIQLRYDALKVLDEAVSICKVGSVSPIHLDGYFARYTNNYPILFLTVCFLKIGRTIGVIGGEYQGAVFFLGLINIFAIDFAIVVIMKLVQKNSGRKNALLFLIWVVLNPLFVIWVPFYYTNTLAMPFVALVLYLFYCVFVEKGRSERYKNMLAFLLGVCVVLGIKIRATTLLTVIACGIYFLLVLYKKKKEGNEKKGSKVSWVRMGCILLGMFLILGIYKAAEIKFVPFDYSETAFPAIHWINMGAGGTGEYSILDEQLTMSCQTREQKSALNWKSYKERLQQMGVEGYISLMLQKLRLTFADSGAGYRSELGVSDLYQDSNLYLVGGKADLIGYLVQSHYVVSLLCLIYFVGAILFQKKVSNNFFVVICWNLVGGFLFHMIWEAGNIYSLSFALLFPISVASVADLETKNPYIKTIIRNIYKEKRGKLSFGVLAGLIHVFTCAVLITLYPAFTKSAYETNDAVVNQYIYHWGESDLLENGEEILQSFYGNRSFNRLSFQVRNTLFEENDGIYQIELLNEDKQCLEEMQINARDYGDYDFIRLPIEKQAGHGSKYYIRIYKVAGSPQGNLVFLSYHTGNYDAYSYGKMETGDDLQDLCFSVYMTKEDAYTSKGLYGLFLVIVLFLEAVIQIGFVHCQREGLSQ